MQVRVSFTMKDGRNMLRVISKAMDITKEREKMEEVSNSLYHSSSQLWYYSSVEVNLSYDCDVSWSLISWNTYHRAKYIPISPRDY